MWALSGRNVSLSEWRELGRAQHSHHGGYKADRGTGKSQGQDSFKDLVTYFFRQGHLLMFAQPPKIAPTGGDQAFKAQTHRRHFIIKF